MATISMLYELPVTITAAPMPCLSHAIFTDKSALESDDYYNDALQDALSADSGFAGASEAYSALCGRPNIDEALQLAGLYRETKNQVSGKYGVLCKISLEGKLDTDSRRDFKTISERLPVKVFLAGSEQAVKRSFKEFIDAVGDPYFVTRGSDYQVADMVLGNYGLKTKRKILGCLGGKHVVPAFI